MFGEVRLRAKRRDAKTTALDVDVPKLQVELPQVTKTGVQSLEARRKNIRVGVYRGSTFVEVPLEKADTVHPVDASAALQASRLDVDVKLREIALVRGNTARVVVAGNPKVVILGAPPGGGPAPPPQITGQVNAVSGWVEVQGKRFEVEKALVTFNGESPPNPQVVATAAWDAPDGTRVFADFAGPLKTGQVAMRSEPPRTKNEILSLVLFGSADAMNPTSGAAAGTMDATNAAFGIGGGIAAQGLTQALDDLAGIRATARIDTTVANNPKPEVEVQISPKITIGFAHVIGTPPITQPDTNFGKFQWRFHPQWSLQTTVGDRGTGVLDAIWQKHY
jgi:translocation and assembly module TamB